MNKLNNINTSQLASSITKSKSLDSLIESVVTTYKLTTEDADQLRSLLQDELSITITQFVDSKLTDDANESNISDHGDRFIMSIPMNDLNELASVCNRNRNNKVNIYIKSLIKTDTVYTTHMDDEGDTFVDTAHIPSKDNLILVGTITRDNANQWMVRIDKSLPTKYVDITMYTRCWLTHNNKSIRDFLNDIFLRINKLGQYSPVGSRSLVTESLDNDYIWNGDPDEVLCMSGVNKADPNSKPHPVTRRMLQDSTNNLHNIVRDCTESVSTDDDPINSNETTYEIEYDPNEIIVYIKDNLDPSLNEDTDDPNEIVTDFLESLPGVDSAQIIVGKDNSGNVVSEKLSSPQKAFLIGLVVPPAIKLLKRIIPSTKSKVLDRSQELVSKATAARDQGIANAHALRDRYKK